MMREGRDKKLTNLGRANGWKGARTLPAVDYLQSQRIRMMMMMKLAEATAHVDVYLGPSNGGGAAEAADAAVAAARMPQAARTPDAPAGTGRRRNEPASVIRRWQTSPPIPRWRCRMDSTRRAHPTSITFFARPFLEAEFLAVVKAYQDATGFHLNIRISARTEARRCGVDGHALPVIGFAPTATSRRSSNGRDPWSRAPIHGGAAISSIPLAQINRANVARSASHGLTTRRMRSPAPRCKATRLSSTG